MQWWWLPKNVIHTKRHRRKMLNEKVNLWQDLPTVDIHCRTNEQQRIKGQRLHCSRSCCILGKIGSGKTQWSFAPLQIGFLLSFFIFLRHCGSWDCLVKRASDEKMNSAKSGRLSVLELHFTVHFFAWVLSVNTPAIESHQFPAGASLVSQQSPTTGKLCTCCSVTEFDCLLPRKVSCHL